VPVVAYGALADGTRPAAYRQGGLERLVERMGAGEVTAMFGPGTPHPSAGVVLLGVRPPLVALNVDLDTGDVELARSIAAAIRERDGGLPGVQALGLRTSNGAQVSTNLIDIDATPLHVIVAEIERLAAEAGAGVRRSELVGLMPARAAAQAAGAALRLPGMAADRTLEVATSGEFGTQT
jgi:glutamate formiminotransferase